MKIARERYQRDITIVRISYVYLSCNYSARMYNRQVDMLLIPPHSEFARLARVVSLNAWRRIPQADTDAPTYNFRTSTIFARRAVQGLINYTVVKTHAPTSKIAPITESTHLKANAPEVITTACVVRFLLKMMQQLVCCRKRTRGGCNGINTIILNILCRKQLAKERCIKRRNSKKSFIFIYVCMWIIFII